eukprot:3265661-Ditylum_brightwellii.AAC.1
MEWEQHPARNSHAEMEGIGGFHSLQDMGWIGGFPSIQNIHLTWDSIVMSDSIVLLPVSLRATSF